ncbi:MAG: hypothetical protein WBA74_05080 [Cyclobacteriaceae bacterium]
MENKDVIESRIEDLKWRALPLFDKLVLRKYQLNEKPFGSGQRRRELKAMIRHINLAIILFAIGSAYIAFSGVNYSSGLSWLFFTALIMTLVVRIELSFRLMCLKEVKLLKKIRMKLSGSTDTSD